jgi:hypothetical protein
MPNKVFLFVHEVGQHAVWLEYGPTNDDIPSGTNVRLFGTFRSVIIYLVAHMILSMSIPIEYPIKAYASEIPLIVAYIFSN